LLALSGLADRYPASRIFFAASVLGALANLGFTLPGNSLDAALAWRFCTGFALAGVYPLGMKLVVSWSPERAGNALGWLVGMLVLGTSLPHFLDAVSFDLDWRITVNIASMLALAGGVIVLLVGNGPGGVSRTGFNWGGVLRAFRHADFRAAAGGYFGHMWEIYALWTVAPFMLAQALPDATPALVSFGAFIFIAVGAAGCVLGGRLSHRVGSARVGFVALLISGTMCLVYPLLLALEISLPMPVLVVLLLAWSAAAAGDSPQFSALIARHAPREAVGSALAIVNGIGFSITVVSISLLMPLWQQHAANAIWMLVPGPFIGLLLLRPLLRSRPPAAGHA
ncbi:MAG: MFS transporter, partial [Proteobacteria bacterium]|nr:MFS transporter [Pseudomonadota bacterium]